MRSSSGHSRTQLRVAGALLLALAPAATAQEPDAPELFRVHCASCHGEDGDGQGTTRLDRPARSFRDGGFSYGNTPEALYRTITGGIPGTPMPGFDTSLDEAERRALANYVTTLGPEAREVTPEETILVVADRPRVVRGLLPPIDGDAPEALSHPRGLLLGTLSGLTFEYRADDVRLLGVRRGAFVERTDWTGRGGTPLRPLGKVVHLVEGGRPEPLFALVTPSVAHPLHAELRRTWIRGDQVGLETTLQQGEREPPLTWVVETVDAYGGAVGAGFVRRFRFVDAAARLTLGTQQPRRGGDLLLASFFQADPGGRHAPRVWNVVKRSGGLVECVGAVLVGSKLRGEQERLEFDVVPGARTELELLTIVTTGWNDDVRRGLGEVGFP